MKDGEVGSSWEIKMKVVRWPVYDTSIVQLIEVKRNSNQSKTNYCETMLDKCFLDFFYFYHASTKNKPKFKTRNKNKYVRQIECFVSKQESDWLIIYMVFSFGCKLS